MLTGLVLDHYYSNTSIITFTIFDKVCELIQIYFEEAEYKRNKLFKWDMITFKSIIKKNKR